MKKIISIIIAFFIIIILLLTSLEINSYDESFFERFQKKYNIDEETNLTLDELKIVNKDLINYLKKGNNQLLEAHFGEREIKHMEDVYLLYHKGRILRNSIFILTIILIIILINKFKLKTVLKELNFAMIIMWIIGILFSVFLLMNFSENFIKFHHIFFDNDLWMLDPNKDMMIRMLPQNFFKAIAIKTLTVFILSFIFVHFIIILIYKKSLNRNGANNET